MTDPMPTEDATPKPTPPATVAEPAQAEGAKPGNDAAHAETDWQVEAKKWEKRAKDNFEKAKRLDEIEESSKSELEKAQAKLAEYEAQVAEANLKALRADIASETGVPPALIQGSDEESMREFAKALTDWRGTSPKAPASDGQGKVGAPIASGVKQLTSDDIKRMTPEQIVAADEAGQFNEMRGIK